MSSLRPKPMRQKSVKATERDQRLAATKRQVLARSGGKCEGCGRKDVALDLAHVAGRGHLLRAELADTPEMCAALCAGPGGCHQKVDRHLDPELRDRVIWAAYDRWFDCSTAGEHWNEGRQALMTLLVHAERNTA